MLSISRRAFLALPILVEAGGELGLVGLGTGGIKEALSGEQQDVFFSNLNLLNLLFLHFLRGLHSERGNPFGLQNN